MVADLNMPRGLPLTMKLLDGGMIVYWVLALLGCIGYMTIPESWMYAGYGDPMIDAWNWSFAPLDIGFSATGLYAIRLAKIGDQRWKVLALLSLALMFCAGLMAVTFWSLIGYFEPSWWLPNLVLITAAVFWIGKLVLRAE